MRSQLLLMGRLYETEDLQHSEKGISARIRLNNGHDVFTGHFPGNPILPGVCTIHIIKELLSEATGKALQLQKASNIKFLAFVDPFAHERIIVDLQYDAGESYIITCQAKMSAGSVIFSSFKGEFLVMKQASAAYP